MRTHDVEEVKNYFLIKFPPIINPQNCRSVVKLLKSSEPNSVLFLHSDHAKFVPDISVSLFLSLFRLLEQSEIKSSENFLPECLGLSSSGNIRLFSVEDQKKTPLKLLENKFQRERSQLILDFGFCSDLPKSLCVSSDTDNKLLESKSQKPDTKCNLIGDCRNEVSLNAVNNHLNENEGQRIKERSLKLINRCFVEKSEPDEGLVKLAKNYILRRGPSCIYEEDENETFSNEMCLGDELPSKVSCSVCPHKGSQTYLPLKFDLHFHRNLKSRSIKSNTEKKKHITCTKHLSDPSSVTGHTGLNKVPPHSSQLKEFNTTEHNKKNQEKRKKLNLKLLKSSRKLTSIPFSKRAAGNAIISIKKLKKKNKKTES